MPNLTGGLLLLSSGLALIAAILFVLWSQWLLRRIDRLTQATHAWDEKHVEMADDASSLNDQ
jgi:HAMP domain-containing protein